MVVIAKIKTMAVCGCLSFFFGYHGCFTIFLYYSKLLVMIVIVAYKLAFIGKYVE